MGIIQEREEYKNLQAPSLPGSDASNYKFLYANNNIVDDSIRRYQIIK